MDHLLYKWDAKEIEEFYENKIKPMVKTGYFPSYNQLFKKWYIAFYVALSLGKTKKYPSVQAFCDTYWLKRLTEKESKWTKEYVDHFFNVYIKPEIKKNIFPKISWFIKMKWEYWGFIQVLNLWKVNGYKNLRDFKEKNWLITEKQIKITKEYIDNFYNTEILKHIKSNKLPTIVWFENKWWKYLSWYQYITLKKAGYDWIKDFCIKNWLNSSKKIWDKSTVDKFYKENIIPLLVDNKFMPFSKFKELDWKYLEWYNTIRNNRVKWYKWIKDFKKKNRLK